MIETARLHIVRFGPEHLSETYVGWLNNRELVRFSQQRHVVHTLESCAAYLRRFDGTHHFFWALLRRDAGLRHIGNMNAYVTEADGVADVGILIGDPESHGRGFGQEAWGAVCAYLLRSGIRKVSAGTLTPNKPMVAIMRGSGMVPDGVRRRHVVIGGEAVDQIHMALFADAGEFPGRGGDPLRP